MDFGIHLGDEPLSTDPTAHLDTLLRQVEAGQRAGFRIFTLGQHFGYRGIRWLQPVPTLARLAAELDDDVRLGTSILIGSLYPPVLLAEELATLDIITGGRLVVGLGTGYLPEEYAMLGVPYADRYRRLEELLALLPRLWGEGPVDHQGVLGTLESVDVHVRPVQQPGPPLWVGAMGPAGVRRAARLADAWTITPQQTVAQVGALLEEFRSARIDAGRPLSPLPLRREIRIGRDRDDAIGSFAREARYKYESYVDRGMTLLSDAEVRSTFEATIADHVILGDPNQCRTQIEDVCRHLPVGPIITRPHWPGMAADDAVAEIEVLGREIVRPLSELTSVSFDQWQAPA